MKPRFAVRAGKDAVLIEPLATPLHAAFFLDLLPGKRAVVAKAAFRNFLPLDEGIVRRCPSGIQVVADAESLSNVEEYVEV